MNQKNNDEKLSKSFVKCNNIKQCNISFAIEAIVKLFSTQNRMKINLSECVNK